MHPLPNHLKLPASLPCICVGICCAKSMKSGLVGVKQVRGGSKYKAWGETGVYRATAMVSVVGAASCGDLLRRFMAMFQSEWLQGSCHADIFYPRFCAPRGLTRLADLRCGAELRQPAAKLGSCILPFRSSLHVIARLGFCVMCVMCKLLSLCLLEPQTAVSVVEIRPSCVCGRHSQSSCTGGRNRKMNSRNMCLKRPLRGAVAPFE